MTFDPDSYFIKFKFWCLKLVAVHRVCAPLGHMVFISSARWAYYDYHYGYYDDDYYYYY